MQLLQLVLVLSLALGVFGGLHDLIEKGKDKLKEEKEHLKEKLISKWEKKDHKVMERMIPMRDGVELHTWIALSRGWKDGDKFPAVMDRSPYGYGDMEWLADVFVPFGFVGVSQDIRGTEKSMGNYTMWQGEADDSRDLGDWIVSQPWSNGEIYTIGASADGIASLQTYKTQPDWLKAQYIMIAPTKPADILLPYGTYKQKTVEDWLHGLNYGVDDPDQADVCIQTAYENESPASPFWDNISEDKSFYETVNYPSAFYGGWWDLFLPGTLDGYKGFNTESQAAVQGTSKIFIDPCGHCLDAQEYFPQHTVEGRSAVFIAQLFDLFGIHDVKRTAIKPVTFYVMSSNDDAGLKAGQFWTSVDAFPTPKMTDYFLVSDGNGGRSVSMSASAAAEGDAAAATSYKVDPSDPIKGNGGANLPPGIGGTIHCGPLEQQDIDNAGRTDLLLFDLPASDDEMVLTGEMTAELYVSSDAVDTDFMVRLSDVYNDDAGTVRLLQDNAVRMRWRENTLEPVYMEGADKVYKIQMSLWATSYVLAPGHQLRVSVQSSNTPRFSVNPQNGLLLADPKYPGENVVAVNTLHHSAQYPSKVTLPLITNKGEALPEVDVLKEIKHELKDVLTDKLMEKVHGYLEKKVKAHPIIDKLINH